DLLEVRSAELRVGLFFCDEGIISGTAFPSTAPTSSPTASPSKSPTESPSDGPTVSPSVRPTASPLQAPPSEENAIIAAVSATIVVLTAAFILWIIIRRQKARAIE